MSKNLLFIVNPISGKGQIKYELLEIIDLFEKSGYIVTVHTTKCNGDASDFVSANIDNYDIIICSGGDGTLNEVVSATINSKSTVKVGYIAAGTTNDFANSVGISKNIKEAAKIAISGKEFACDIGKFNDRYFLYVAAFGIFTNVSYSTPQEAKNIFGHLAYVLESTKHLSDYKSYHLKIVTDDSIIEDDFLFGMISNSHSVGGFKNLVSHEVQMNDGLFEVLLAKMPTNIMEFRTMIKDLLSHEMNSDYIYRFTTSNLEVFCDKKLNWTIDGEFGGELSSVSIKNLNKAVTFVI